MDYFRNERVSWIGDKPDTTRKLLPKRRRRKHARAWSVFQQFYNPDQAEVGDDLLENDPTWSKSAIASDATTSTPSDASGMTPSKENDEIGSMKGKASSEVNPPLASAATTEAESEQQIRTAANTDEVIAPAAVEKSPSLDGNSRSTVDEEITSGVMTTETAVPTSRKLLATKHLRHKHSKAWSVLQSLYNQPQEEESDVAKDSPSTAATVAKQESGVIEFLDVDKERDVTSSTSAASTTAEVRPIEFLSLSNADVGSNSNVTIIALMNDTISSLNETLSMMNNATTTIPTWTNITAIALNSTTVADTSNSTFTSILGNSTSTWSNSTLAGAATNGTSSIDTGNSNSTFVGGLGNSTALSASNSTLTSANTTTIELSKNGTTTTTDMTNSTTIIPSGGDNSTTTIVIPSNTNTTDSTASNSTVNNLSNVTAVADAPSSRPSVSPTTWPTSMPSSLPSSWPTLKPIESTDGPSSRPSVAPTSLRVAAVNESGVISTSLSKSAIAGICFAVLFALFGCFVLFRNHNEGNNQHRKGAKRLEDDSPAPSPLQSPSKIRSFNELCANDDEEESNDSAPLASRYAATSSNYQQKGRVPPPLALSGGGHQHRY